MSEYQYYDVVAVDGPIADYPHIEPSAGETLTCVEFAGKALAVRKARLESEAKAAAAQKRPAAEARKRPLEDVMKRSDGIWAGLEPLMEEKIASAYDHVADQSKELRDAYQQANSENDFQHRLEALPRPLLASPHDDAAHQGTVREDRMINGVSHIYPIYQSTTIWHLNLRGQAYP